MPVKPSIVFLFLVLIIAFPLFSHIGAPPLQLWDESRLAINAFEMSHSHNWIVTTTDGRPDMWNTKPPLMIWLQAAMINLFGPGELAIRLPSVFAAFFTCLLLFYLISKKYKEHILAIICAIILVSSLGFVNMHGSRSGDYDSLLTLFMTGYGCSFFLYLQEQKKKYLYAFFILLILAALTKGIESLMFLPALLIYAIYRKKTITILKQKETYMGLAAFIIFVIGYYLLREHYNPGYLAAVQHNEIAGRYNTVIENHRGGDWYYFEILINNQFHEWYLLVIPGLIAGFLSKNKIIKEITIFSFIIALTYLLILSGAKTMIDWYTMPLMPFLSILAGIFVYLIYNLLNDLVFPLKYMSFNCLPLIFLFLLTILPYSNAINIWLSRSNSIYMDNDDMAELLKDVLHHDQELDSFVILNTEFQQNYAWYVNVLKYQKKSIGLIDTDKINPAYKIAARSADSKKYIDSNYNNQIVQTFGNVTIYKVNGRR